MMLFELRARHVFAALAIMGALQSTRAEPLTASFPRLGRVTASSGLTLRTSPKASAPSITVIPNGANVFVVRPTSQMDTIEGIKASWFFISYGGQSGFVFSGFLTSDLQQRPDFTEEDATIIRRLAQLSGLRVPSLKVRYPMRGNPYVADHFTLKDRRQLGSFIVAIIAPEKTDCQGFFDECFSLIGTTNGEYLFSDVDTFPVGPLYYADSRLVFFMQTEAE
ncbi:MAG TPA: hypothetical protein PLG78_17540, partial [Leptospiraceae bacterium]|nr:hypothetical protein [Leptospiraceae bacterium]